ncbi:MAG: hypothetical protein IKU25_09140 [Clostridia bacterium]|nr:hypothetical protein [Clostridia bacterium]
MSKKILAVVLALVMVFSVMLPMTIASAATGNMNEVSYQIIDGKLYVKVITDDSYNRVALFYADNTALAACIETTSSYVVDGDSRVWTLKIDAPVEPTTYVVRGRDAETNSYKNGGTSDAFSVAPEYPFYYVAPQAIAGKVTITVKSNSPYINKVAVVNPATGEYVGYDSTPELGTDYENETIWTITFPYVEGNDTYLVKARDSRTGKYGVNMAVETEINFHEEPILDVEVTDYDADNVLVKVTTIPDIYRVKIAYANDAKGCIVYAKDYVENENYEWEWEMIIPRPAIPTEFAIDTAITSKAYARYFTYVTIGEVPPAPEFFAENTANTITGGWYTTTDGLVQIYVADWSYYGAYGLTLVKNPLAYPTSAATIAVYAADSDEVFANKTADDFAAVLGEAVTSFEAVTVAGEYAGYVAKTATYRNLVFQANGAKYFINFINGGDGTDMDAMLELALNNIVVCKPAPAPVANTVADGWYTTTDGLVQAYVGKWVYYGSYGLTLVAAYAAPIDAATFAVYAADADDVFAAKTADDFAAVLGEAVTSFEAVTVAGQYPGYIAITATYRNLVFQANGYKYFINYINADDGVSTENAFKAVVNSIIVYEPAVCTHANTTTDEVAATCTTDGYKTVTCDDCGEEISSEVYTATGHVNTTTDEAPATCTTDGYKIVTCACGEVISSEVYTATGHAYGAWTITTMPTIGVDGEKTCTCANCDDVKVEVLAALTTPNADAAVNAVENGWYTTADGLVQLYVADWSYYGAYGLTLVKNPLAYPTSAATIAVYAADADDVFAAKTAADFEAVLGETITSFEAVTVAGQYPGFIAHTATYCNLVFQANGFKYFINYINGADGTDIETEFAIMAANVVVYTPCTHANTTVTTVDPTCTVEGTETTTCDDCGEVISTEVIPATGHVDTTTTTVDATCVAEGSITVTCACGEVVSTEVIPATGIHTYTYEITKIPTTDEEGIKTYTCNDCGNFYTEGIYALTTPAAPNANQVENNWYTTTDGLVQLYVDDWGYYGAYGLTLVKSFVTYPTSAATIAVYAADADDVFANKTAADFEAVLGETVTSFTAVTVAGQYPGFIAYTATYRNLVFQANGAKYFINVIAAPGEEAMCDAFFAIMAANVIVIEPCAHEAYTWEITTMPAIDVAGEKTFTCTNCGDTYTEAMAALTAPTSAEANTVADTWYTTNDGLVQLYVADWMYYGSYGLTLVKSGSIPTSAATIAVYAADADDVFAAKTKADFESVLQETINEFYAVTIAGQYPGYVAYTASYRNLVFQANGAKYFINIIGIEGEQDACEELFQIMMANVIVNEPAACEHANTTVVETVAGTYNTKGTGDVVCDDCGEVVEAGVATSYVAPAAELWNTVTADGWYITNDGKVAMNVGSWVYYGQYGLTLVGAAGVVPIDAATIAVYTADSDEVFANKTADDFAGVLQETVDSFEAVEICGFPGYIAKTASYRNLVFQANGFKYFINYMPVAGDSANVDAEADFAIAVDSIIVY